MKPLLEVTFHYTLIPHRGEIIDKSGQKRSAFRRFVSHFGARHLFWEHGAKKRCLAPQLPKIVERNAAFQKYFHPGGQKYNRGTNADQITSCRISQSHCNHRCRENKRS